jgi:hypothetical protein
MERVIEFMIKREKISIDTNSNHEKFDFSVNKFDSIRGVLLWYFFDTVITEFRVFELILGLFKIINGFQRFSSVFYAF